MKNDYGIIDPKAVENALMIEKFNDYVIQTISKGETEFYIYGTDDKRLCQTLLYLKKILDLIDDLETITLFFRKMNMVKLIISTYLGKEDNYEE